MTPHQVLLVYGAEVTDEILRVENFLFYPGGQSVEVHRDYLEFFKNVVTVRSPLEIAVACRLHADARSALQIGRIDARGLAQTALTALANVGPGVWPSAPAVCEATVAFAAEAAAGWFPHTHHLFHPPVRTAVATLFAVAHRQRQRQRADATVGAASSLNATAVAAAGPLPAELWRLICTFVRRPGWAMEQWRPPASMMPVNGKDAEADTDVGDPGGD